MGSAHRQWHSQHGCSATGRDLCRLQRFQYDRGGQDREITVHGRGWISMKSQWIVKNGRCWALITMLAGALSACVPSLYGVNVRYEPTKTIRPMAPPPAEYLVTVATFEDLRNVQNRMAVGMVVDSAGEKIPVVPKNSPPQDAVSSGIRDYLRRTGFKISDQKPGWDLKNDSIQEDWGDLLIGGNIDELSVKCEDRVPVRYQAHIKLRVMFADVRHKWIFYKTVTQSSSSVERIFFFRKTNSRIPSITYSPMPSRKSLQMATPSARC